MAISTYCYDDPRFPRSFDNEPRPATVNAIRVLKKKLDLLYKSKLRKQPAELFLRKTDEATAIPPVRRGEEDTRPGRVRSPGILDSPGVQLRAGRRGPGVFRAQLYWNPKNVKLCDDVYDDVLF